MSEAVRPSTRSLIVAGLAALRREPTLVAVRWAGDLAVLALAVAGTLAPAWALFGGRFAERLAPLVAARDVDALAEAVLDLWIAVTAAPGRVVAGLGGLAAAWTLALAVYCWVQGGFYGVLVAAGGEPGSAGTAPGRPRRAFSPAAFAAAGCRGFWRFFWFVNLYATVLGLIALIALLPLSLVPPAEPGTVPVVALVVLAAVTPPAALATAVAALWFALGRADLARAGSGVTAAARRGVAVLRRRPAPVLAIAAFALAAGLAVSGVGAALGRVAGVLGGGAGLAGGAVVAAVQGLAMTGVATAHAAAMVRLMRSEWPAGEGA